MKPLLVSIALAGILWGTAGAEVVGTPVEYTAGDTVLKGYLAYDTAVTGKRPGIVVVHEWWGHNDYVRRRARMLAELGYTALAVDMYGDGKQADHPEDARTFATAVRQNMPVMEGRFLAAVNLLKRHPTVDPERIGAIGYCFGGGVVIQMARNGLDLAAVVSFHGSLATEKPATPGSVKARILVLNGGDDAFVTPAQISAFKKEMDDAGARYEFVSYPGAVHGFTNPEADAYAQRFNMGLGYNAAADQASWARMVAFFKDVFR